MRRTLVPLAVCLVGALAWALPLAAASTPSLLDILSDELQRNFTTLKQKADPPPYYMDYTVTDEDSQSVSAMMGSPASQNKRRLRVLDVTLRVGAPELDNYHQVNGQRGRFTRGDVLPLDDVPDAIRRKVWLATDRTYRSASRRLIEIKSNQETKVKEADSSADFSIEPPSVYQEPPPPVGNVDSEWVKRVRKWSADVANSPDVLYSNVNLSVERVSKYMVSTEGTRLVHGRDFASLSMVARGKATDGMDLMALEDFQAADPAHLPAQAVLDEAAARVGEKLSKLVQADAVEPFVGPAILSGRAAAVFFHEIFGHRIEGHRQKDEGEGQTFTKSVGMPVLPSFLSVVFDPTRRTLGGVDLNGYYSYDDEGVKARPVTVVENGVLKTFLMSRSPIQGVEHSNGHGRRQPGLEVVSRQSNLIVESTKQVSEQALREMLVAEIKRQNKPYGLLFDEVTGGYTTTQRRGLQAFTVMPLMVYRVYADGRPDQLVRGVDIVGTPLASFSKILATSDKPEVFNGYCGAESGQVPVSASSPALLVSEIEIQKKQHSQDRPPFLGRPVDLGSFAVKKLTCVLLAVVTLSAQSPAGNDSDTLLRAMKDELKRSSELIRLGLQPPYYMEYRAEDTVSYAMSASLGALMEAGTSAYRVPTVRVRVGNYDFDNTNHVYSEAYVGSRYDPDRLPLDDNYIGFREVYWLATDRAFKTAQDAIARKRSSLKNMSLPDALPDFSKAPPAQLILPIQRKPSDVEAWKKEIVKLSGVFAAYPQVLSSGVEMQSSQSTDYMVNTEGTTLRLPEDLAYIRVLANGLAADGTNVRDAQVVQAFEADELPSEADLTRAAKDVAEHVAALAQAPPGESYDGPVLFEAVASAQLFGQLLADNLKLIRKPVADPGRVPPVVSSELENRVGSRIFPDWMDVVDDSTQAKFEGHTLLGHYLYDIEGVAPKPVTLIEKGVLKAFLLTRTPVFKDYPGSNGHARLSGSFGDQSAGFGNLFVRASQTTPAAGMKQKLIDMCKERNKPYGILIRKLDFPSSASIDELRRLVQASGGSHAVTAPLLAYKVYPDGREELVRSLVFHGVSTRSFKDIVAASDENHVFDMIDSDAIFARMGAGSYITTASVIAPAVLFEELELAPVEEEKPQPPIVPPPALGAQPVTTAAAGAKGR